MIGTAVVLGSTGSVGTQALDVIEKQSIQVDALSAGSNAALLEEQIRRFRPKYVGVRDEDAAKDLRLRVADLDVRLVVGKDSASEIASLSAADIAINAVTGIAGLSPTVSAIQSGKHVALANKETMVAYGEQIMHMAKEKGVRIFPVDSEHCAIFQCLQGNRKQDVARLWITASGGPFYKKSAEEMTGVTPAQALAHPTWKMGKRITIDSATLMNKGFEVIEAIRLFGIAPSRVRVLIHPESIIHSMVEYIDSAVIAQLSVPDMRLCVQYALSWPNRFEGSVSPLSLGSIGALHFEDPDYSRFPLLSLAFSAVERGGTTPAVMNAADEAAVSLFLEGKIGFCDIASLVCQVTEETKTMPIDGLSSVLEADAAARDAVFSLACFK